MVEDILKTIIPNMSILFDTWIVLYEKVRSLIIIVAFTFGLSVNPSSTYKKGLKEFNPYTEIIFKSRDT